MKNVGEKGMQISGNIPEIYEEFNPGIMIKYLVTSGKCKNLPELPSKHNS
jgi:hypothetical protein